MCHHLIQFFLDPPSIPQTGPSNYMRLKTKSILQLECTADGNPAPTFKWIQKFPTGISKVRGYEAKLVIQGVTFKDNSRMVCEASNYINNIKQHSKSEPVELIITGEPIFRTKEKTKDIVLKSGEDTKINIPFCSNPRPTVKWFTANKGTNKTPITSHNLVESSDEHCYTSILTIRNMQKENAKDYYIQVSNEEGKIIKRMKVKVSEELFELEMVVLIVIGLVLSILILSLAILYFMQARRLGGEMSITTASYKEDQENTKDCETCNECTMNPPDLVPSYHVGQS